MGRLEINAKMPDMVNSAWVGAQSNDFTDVDVAAMHDELERRLGWGQRRVDLPAGEYETILPPGAVVDLLVYAYWTMSARDAQEGRSAGPPGSVSGSATCRSPSPATRATRSCRWRRSRLCRARSRG
jgi:predicted Zn-dependent protease